MSSLVKKSLGAYYTPDDVAASLTCWVIESPKDLLLDPACGDGRFLALHDNSIGVEKNEQAILECKQKATQAEINHGNFFAWAMATSPRFDCAAGNPPFIRYQSFAGQDRALARDYCRSLGVRISGLSSSWAPFLIGAASLLKPGGRMAFVVPAEIGHSSYAAPVLEYLIGRFEQVQIVAIRDKLFPELSEDCWLLYAQGFGGTTSKIELSIVDRFNPSAKPPRVDVSVDVSEWRETGRRRLRPYFLPSTAREIYSRIANSAQSFRFGEIADIGIGYVSGANDFFHLRPSEVDHWKLPKEYLVPTVRTGRSLKEPRLNRSILDSWLEADNPVWLLRLNKRDDLPDSVSRYLESPAGQEARKAYKCRNRLPWYVVPDVRQPDFFLTYMSGKASSLVLNELGSTCTNSLLAVTLRRSDLKQLALNSWNTTLTQLSCELEGHALGGGMLKLEPREAQNILLSSETLSPEEDDVLREALSTMRYWRHYDREQHDVEAA